MTTTEIPTVTDRDALVSRPADVITHGSRVISIDGDSTSGTCDLCRLLWPARSVAFRASIGTFECRLCTPGPYYVVFIDDQRDPTAFVVEADALAYADVMADRGHRVYTDARRTAAGTQAVAS